MDSTTQEQVAEHLSAALDAVLAAVVLADGLTADVPDEALDSALASDEGVREARGSFQEALQAVKDLGVVGEPYLRLEAAVNALAAMTAEAGYRVGARVGRGLG